MAVEASFLFLRSAWSSWPILPLQTRMRSASPMSRIGQYVLENSSEVKSAMGEDASGMAQHALGREDDQRLAPVAQRPGGEADENIARRWKAARSGYMCFAGAEGSARCERWNVPAPGLRNRWGRSRTRPESSVHFASPAEINWSMMACPTFTKSPNCASHKTKASG